MSDTTLRAERREPGVTAKRVASVRKKKAFAVPHVDLVKLATATRPTQGAIIAAAVETFTKNGFAATRVEDILQSAGVARRTFYKHYGSKEDVLAAVYELATTELLNAMRVVGTSGGDPLDAVRLGLDLYLDYHLENGPLVRILVESAMRSDSPLAGARQRFRTELARLLGDAVRARTGTEHDPLVYTALIAAVEGLSLDLLAQGVNARDVARAKGVFHLMLARLFG